MSNVKHIGDAEFKATVESNPTVLVDFWAPWCGPCKAIGPVLDTLADEYKGRATIAKVNVDENAATAAEFGIRSIPTLIVFKNGKIINQITGSATKQQLQDLIDSGL